jgi:hypothetical protein
VGSDGWPNDRRFPQPTVQASWESSCVQLVWMYGEIAGNRAGGSTISSSSPAVAQTDQPDGVDDNKAVEELSLRVATVDVGGGTTDLMITTYYVDDTSPDAGPEFPRGLSPGRRRHPARRHRTGRAAGARAW